MLRPDPNLFNALTHYPEKRADIYARELADRLQAIRDKAASLNAAPGAVAIPDDVVAQLIARHERMTQAMWNAEGRCMSWFVVGPANFPTARNEKLQRSRDKRAGEVSHHLVAALRRLERMAWPHGAPGDAIRSNDPDALDKLRAKLADAKRAHEVAKTCNALARKGDWEGVAHLVGPAVAARAQRAAEDWGGGSFFPANRLAEVRRIEARIAQLERAQERGTVEKEAVGGVRLVENAGAARVQLIFPGKPDGATRALLKSSGFRWAPSEGAWQRHLNNAGRYAAQRVLEALGGAAPAKAEPAASEVGQRWRGNGPRITAAFDTADDANAYMAAHPGEGVVAVEGGRVLIADCSDLAEG